MFKNLKKCENPVVADSGCLSNILPVAALPPLPGRNIFSIAYLQRPLFVFTAMVAKPDKLKKLLDLSFLVRYMVSCLPPW
jgi:hypothetical protein